MRLFVQAHSPSLLLRRCRVLPTSDLQSNGQRLIQNPGLFLGLKSHYFTHLLRPALARREGRKSFSHPFTQALIQVTGSVARIASNLSNRKGSGFRFRPVGPLENCTLSNFNHFRDFQMSLTSLRVRFRRKIPGEMKISERCARQEKIRRTKNIRKRNFCMFGRGGIAPKVSFFKGIFSGMILKTFFWWAKGDPRSHFYTSTKKNTDHD